MYRVTNHMATLLLQTCCLCSFMAVVLVLPRTCGKAAAAKGCDANYDLLCQIYGAQATLVLRADEAERLRPEETVDPILHRFVNHLATLAVDREAPVPAPDEDPWVSTVLEPRWDVMPAARDALAGVAAHFTMTPAVRNP